MRKVLAILAISLLWVVFPARTLAQTSTVIDELRITIWPEYDQPSVLVFYLGQTAPETSVPADLNLPLPENASLNAAAYLDATSGNLLLLTDAEQAANSLNLASPNGSFHIEFYDPSISFGENNQRTYDLTFNSDYAINRLFVEFQHPSGATDIVTTPANGIVGMDQVGLQSTVVEVGAVAAGSPVELSMSYVKEGSMLSVQALNPGFDQQPAAEPVSQPVVTPSGPSPVLIGVGAGLLALIVVGVVLWQTGRLGAGRSTARPASTRSGSRRSQKSAPRTRAESAADKRFCTQCGSSVGHDDRFCRNCGNALH